MDEAELQRQAAMGQNMVNRLGSHTKPNQTKPINKKKKKSGVQVICANNRIMRKRISTWVMEPSGGDQRKPWRLDW